ncbi:beta-lactamase family protein [Nocardioides sp. W3-2-3]|uniref:serine hydrolase domain-containing protein n=1 Tax=Nocardioides convexus TaxID=2712224 RepID=UPI00310173C5|nr:beta-lactamase family protein [Nocardioides convexus]
MRRLEPTGTTGEGTPYRIASLTKPFTALATVLACRRAGVALDTPVLAVLPELADDWAAERTITVADLLAQTAGLAPSVSAAEVAALGEGDGALRETARLVVRAGSVRSPGQRWEYYNGNYFLAGAVLAALTGGTYEDALAGLVLGPWGLDATTFAPSAGVAAYPRGRRPSGGLCSTAADLLTAGERLLGEPDLLAEVAKVRTAPADPQRYGLGWAVGPSGQAVPQRPAARLPRRVAAPSRARPRRCRPRRGRGRAPRAGGVAQRAAAGADRGRPGGRHRRLRRLSAPSSARPTKLGAVPARRRAEAAGEVLAEQVVGGVADRVGDGAHGQVGLLEEPLRLADPQVVEPGERRDTDVRGEPAVEGARRQRARGREVGDAPAPVESGDDVELEPLDGGCRAGGDARVGVLRLGAGPEDRGDHRAGDLLGGVGAPVRADQVEQEVDPGGDAGRGPHAVASAVQVARAHGDRRVPSRQARPRSASAWSRPGRRAGPRRRG